MLTFTKIQLFTEYRMGKLFKATSEQTYKQMHRFILLEATGHLFDMKKYHLYLRILLSVSLKIIAHNR